MNKIQNLLNSSADSHVFCYRNGIKLIKPEQLEHQKPSAIFYDTGHTVASILTLPLNVTFLNIDANTRTINEQSAETSGFASIQSAIGKSIKDVTKSKSGEIIMSHNREVMDFGVKRIFEETIIRKNNTNVDCISVKSPWYDSDGKVIGLFGCGSRLQAEKLSLSESLSLISKIGMLNKNTSQLADNIFLPGRQINNNYFTKRENEVMHYLVRGKTAKGIADKLKLSQRTVECYLVNLKHKLGASNKSELIEKILDCIYTK
jgi:DNA-binding CsgD family transcriptional regulator